MKGPFARPVRARWFPLTLATNAQRSATTEKITTIATTGTAWVCAVAALFLLASTSVLFAKGQKKSAASSKEKPEAILSAAKKVADAKAWSVRVHVNAEKDMNISGIIFGKDFDLTIETIDGTTRQIVLGDKSWSSDDGGKTWKENKEIDRRFYYLVHTPIKYSAGEKIPPFAAVGTEELGAQPLLHIRFIAPDKITYEGDRANYWIVMQDPKSPVIHRFLGPMGFENNYVTDSVDYTPIGDERPVLPPPGNPHAQAAAPGPEALLMGAMKKMSTGVWSVKGAVAFKKIINLHGLLSGEDFDLSMEPGVKPGVPMRGIVIKDRAWVCSDGETWHAGSPDDRLLYNWAHTPIMAGRLEPPFEKVADEQHDGQTWLHIQLKVAEAKADPKSLPQYWLVLDSQGQARYIAHTEMQMMSRGGGDVVHCSFDYAPASEKITPPPLGPPVDDKAYGFNDIEQHKFDWKGKIVRVEVTPKLLQSEQIGEDTYRAFLKDTATPNHYGVVEFPHDALVKLGFLKKIVSGTHAWNDLEKTGALGRTEGEPVSFYVQVIPIGEKPAARAVAVGAKLVREADGTVSYTWESGANSSPDAAEHSAATGSASSRSPEGEESVEDLVNRGIEKGKNGDLDGAIADFTRASELNPKDDAPFYNRAQAKRLKKDAAGAIADYTRAIELGSTNPAAYNNRGNARAENNDRDGAIADYTRAIQLKPDYARAYYNRAVAKKEKGDTTGAAADFKHAQQLDPELTSEESAADSTNNRTTASNGTTVSLLDGKLKIDLPSDFARDATDPKDPKTVAKFSGPDGAWGEVLRGTHGLTPEDLPSYLKKRVDEYSKGFKWLPKDSHLQWLKKEIVTVDGRKWADWSFVPMLKGKKDYSHNPVYTRNLTTSYKGQLLEINFTSNLNTDPKLKKEIDHIIGSVHLEK